MSVLRKKYKSSKIEVTFVEDNEQIHNALLSLQTVTNVWKVRQTYHLTVNRLHKARQEDFQAALEQDWSITTSHINQSSLEARFMKAVNALCSAIESSKKS